MIGVGCAGWSLPREVQDQFGEGASHLARYATRFPVTEINSTFHRPHKPFVFERWAASVPAGFRFSAKLPRTITHERRMVDCDAPLRDFLAQLLPLGDKLDCLLVQLPPSLAFDAGVAADFLRMLRERFAGALALEPRHATWFDAAPDAVLRQLQIARVLADPVRHDAGRAPGGWPRHVYLRLHGSPRMYYSSYPAQQLQALATRLLAAEAEGAQAWCIFDNTAAGAAAADALLLLRLLQEARETAQGSGPS